VLLVIATVVAIVVIAAVLVVVKQQYNIVSASIEAQYTSYCSVTACTVCNSVDNARHTRTVYYELRHIAQHQQQYSIQQQYAAAGIGYQW
jgi:hypothetical protein